MTKKSARVLALIEEIIAIFIVLLGLLLVSAPSQMEATIPYLVIAYLVASAIIYFFLWVKGRDIKDLIESIIWIVLTIVLVILFLILPQSSSAVAISMGSYCILKSLKNIIYAFIVPQGKRNRLFLAIGTLIHAVLAISIFYSLSKGAATINEFIAIYGITYIFEGTVSFFGAFARKHEGILMHILKETYVKEILSGLILAIVVASLIFVLTEPDIPTFGDALWYCFAIVTTIGFGDFTAKYALGRLVSVALGIYGIIVVALITSIIVNVYSEKKASKGENKEALEEDTTKKEE